LTGRKTGTMQEPELVTATRQELDDILARCRTALTPQQFRLLQGVLDTFVYLTLKLQNARVSLGRLKRLLFGSRTERLRDVAEDAKLANAPPDGAAPDDHAAAATDAEPTAGAGAPAATSVAVPVVTRRRKGHGRNGADAYRGAEVVECMHDELYGAVDGQKFGVERPTAKARHSRKYFGRGKGVVAYTLLCNHIPLQGWLIGAHELEAHHVFDLWYRNTSDIVPEVITGDMHSVNKVNFAILHWFGRRFEPRFTDLDKQIGELCCAGDPAHYDHCLVKPAGRIDLAAIEAEKANLDRIVATLGLKEMTQGTLVRKLCTYEADPTRRAIFEYDRLVRSTYMLRYLRDPQLQRNVHRSQNRIESYHQLRSAIAQVAGKKELTGRTDLEIEISNQCARLVANAIVYYNSAILSRLLAKAEASGSEVARSLATSTSPVA